MRASEASYEVDIDREKNRVYLELSGMLDEDLAHEAADAVIDAAGEMDPGFDMVNDISTFKPMSDDATDAIDRGKRGVAEEGVTAVARIVGDSVIGKMQFDRVAGDVNSYHVTNVESMEQAERMLDEFREE